MLPDRASGVRGDKAEVGSSGVQEFRVLECWSERQWLAKLTLGFSELFSSHEYGQVSFLQLLNSCNS
jgi:hypothetical protein